jgi:hypothetical protein
MLIKNITHQNMPSGKRKAKTQQAQVRAANPEPELSDEDVSSEALLTFSSDLEEGEIAEDTLTVSSEEEHMGLVPDEMDEDEKWIVDHAEALDQAFKEVLYIMSCENVTIPADQEEEVYREFVFFVYENIGPGVKEF